jgi:hypothetical protein
MRSHLPDHRIAELAARRNGGYRLSTFGIQDPDPLSGG